MANVAGNRRTGPKAKNAGPAVESFPKRARLPIKLTPTTIKDFLTMIEDGASATQAAERLNCSAKAFYKRAQQDQDFADAWVEAKDLGRLNRSDIIEATIWDRAIDGYNEVEKRTFKLPNGEERVASKVVRKVDNTLLMRLAEAHMPERYRNLRIDKVVDVGEGLRDLMERAAENPASSLASAIKE